ncbi:hypothetical protein FSC37_18055 [Piscinibacter aquaticus]|uniref:Tetratricopeptide repeat protein n=1 Tax=Piscinibacter aquaticus TaxID=392597 RepID=A0A5C6U249_9BURK|nr:hypothetical protein FSC37_18055 [Piscinibacter aquaticus]
MAPPTFIRLAAGWLCAAIGLVATAAPFTPRGDEVIVERLPARESAETRRQRAALARDPAQLPLALATARAAIERARQHGDPRELGLAQAALKPWWAQPAPPAAVRLLRATIRQSQHDFDGALADLDALAVDATAPLPLRAQARLTRATVRRVTGRLEPAEDDCRALAGPDFASLGAALSVPARACLAELRSLRGQPREAAIALTALAREAPADGWLALVRAELAQRLGDHVRAEALFREATAGTPGVYAIAARADWLIERGRAAEALALIEPQGVDADALLLRRAIARRRLGDARAAADAATLQARFDAARQRGENLHLREEALLALELQGDPAKGAGTGRAELGAAEGAGRCLAAGARGAGCRPARGGADAARLGGHRRAHRHGRQGGALMTLRQLFTLALALVAGAAQAHKSSDAYLRWQVDGARIEQRVDIALRDLDRELELDADGDGQLRWGGALTLERHRTRPRPRSRCAPTSATAR